MLDNNQLLKLLKNGNENDKKLLQLYLQDPYYSFRARPDRPEVFDEQDGFVNSKFNGISCCVAGNASGKSYSAAYKVARFLRTTPPPTDLCKYFVASQTMQMVGALWQEKLSRFIPIEMIESVNYWNSKECHPKTVIFKPHANGNRWMINFRSYEQGRKSFQAISECAGYYLDEQLPSLNLLSEIDTRTREFSYPGSKIYVLTPLEPDQDLQERFDNPSKFPFWSFFRQNAEMNFEMGGINNLQWLENTPEDMRETRRIGDFAQFSGQIFKEFNEREMCIPEKVLPAGTVYYRSVDFGYSHDTACILIGKTPSDEVYIMKEWSASKMLIGDKVKTILDLMPHPDAALQKHPSLLRMTTFADPADAQQRAEFAKLGLHTVPAKKEPVSYSIEIVRRRMAGKKLYIFDNCKKLIKEIKNYRWRESSRMGDDAKERPIKRGDDLVDCMRMACFSLELNSILPWELAKVNINKNRI